MKYPQLILVALLGAGHGFHRKLRHISAGCLRVGLVVTALVSLATSSRADVAFSDLDSVVPYYDANSYYGIEGALDPNGSETWAAQFTPQLSGNLSAILLGLTLTGLDGHVNVYLKALSSPGFLSVSNAILLGTATTTTAFAGGDGSSLTSVTLLAPGSISLTANQGYFLILQPGNPNTAGAWNLNNTGATGTVSSSTNLGASFSFTFNDTLPAFEIDVTSVPEPSTYAMMALGVGLLGAGQRFRRKLRWWT